MGNLGKLICLMGLLAAAAAQLDSYLTDKYVEPNSEEHGQTAGKKSTTCRCGWTNKDSGRIVGGKRAQVNEYPHMVALGKVNYMGGIFFFCGGTIITKNHVITAAHCITSGKHNLFVVAGEHDKTSMFESKFTKRYPVAEIYAHEEYSTTTHVNDIAILYIKEAMQFNQAVGPACMPKKPVNLVNKYVKVTGWGHETWKGQGSSVLNKVHLKVYDIAVCAAKYPSSSIKVKGATQFCTYAPAKDSCQGDSGGPVTWLDPETNRYTLVGVVSYGMECASTTPGVNTDIHSYMNWIESKTQETTKNSGGAEMCFRKD